MQADLADKTTWLQSSNIANTEFYNEHGFFTVGTVVLGEHSDRDPTLDDQPEPVVVSIVRRSILQKFLIMLLMIALHSKQMIREPKKPEGLEPKWG